MGCSIINIKVVNCQIQVTDTCAKDQICYFDKVLKASKNRIWFSMGGLICSYDVRSIAIPNFATGTEIADLLNTQLEECRNLVTVDMPPVEPVKEIVETITVVDPDNPKKTITLFLFKNPTCVTTDIEGTNIVNLNDYEMANTPGYGRALPKNSSPLIPFSLCGPLTGTLADILTELATDTDFETAVTEEVPTGLTRLQIYQAPKGTTCKGQPVTAGGVLIGSRSLDDAEGWCKKKDYEDKDCDSYSEGIDLTTTLEIPAGAAILGEAIGICIDADDNDAAVQ